MKNTVRLKKSIMTAILAALSIVLYVIGPKFPIPAIFPSFLSVNFSMIPIFIAILMIDYKSGLAIVFIRFIFGFITGTHTAGIGETADLIIGLFLVLFTSLGKLLFKDKLRFIPLFLFSILGWVVGGLISNIFALPMYINVMGYTPEMFASMLAKIHPLCTKDNFIFYYFVLAILPFNLMLSNIVVWITYLLYLPLNNNINNYFDEKVEIN